MGIVELVLLDEEVEGEVVPREDLQPRNERLAEEEVGAPLPDALTHPAQQRHLGSQLGVLERFWSALPLAEHIDGWCLSVLEPYKHPVPWPPVGHYMAHFFLVTSPLRLEG